MSNIDWTAAEEHLLMIQDDYLHHGAHGVGVFMMDVVHLRRMFDGGERTRELHDAIMRLKKWEER